MSFTTEIKHELCRVTVTGEAALAECLGMLLFAGQLSRTQMRMGIEDATVRRRVQTILRQTLNVFPEEDEGLLLITDREQLDRIFAAYGYDSGDSLPLNRAMVEEENCKNALLRGAFLVGGYVSTPDKGYHLELVTAHYHVARQVSALLNDMELSAGLINRRGAFVLYYKDSAAIEDFLSATGATAAAMDLMLKKVERELRNEVNRKVNCETANVNKTVSAAAAQVEAIRALQSSGRFESLSPRLKATAQLRMEHPELSLTELCQLSKTPISRPGLNNRLRRLVQLSQEEQS